MLRFVTLLEFYTIFASLMKRQRYYMKTKKRQRRIKFPENKEINITLQQGDRVIIASYSGLKPGTIRDMMCGYSRITDSVKKAIIRLTNERQSLNNKIKKLKNQ